MLFQPCLLFSLRIALLAQFMFASLLASISPLLAADEEMDWDRVRSILPGCEARQNPDFDDPSLTPIEMIARADYYFESGVPHSDRCEGLHWLMAAGRRGSGRAFSQLILKGSPDTRRWLIMRAAENGHSVSQWYIGAEAEQNHSAMALPWYRKAAWQGEDIAIHDIVRILEKENAGSGEAEARHLADAGIAAAQRVLADRLYKRGDFAQASLLFRQAAESAFSGTPFSDCGVCPPLIVIKRGDLMMGSTDSIAPLAEGPLHMVTLIHSFAMARIETSQREWSACVAAGACQQKPGADGKKMNGLALHQETPATHIGWDDAQAYVAWLSGLTGKVYRLPTEAEWEYAIRGPWEPEQANTYWWGKRFWPQVEEAWRSNSQNWTPQADDPLRIAPMHPGVEEMGDNAFGLFDMAGGVSEWVADCWHPTYGGAPEDGSSWSEPGCTEHVVRGGHKGGGSQEWRSSFRRSGTGSGAAVGFRVVRELPEAKVDLLQRVCLHDTKGSPIAPTITNDGAVGRHYNGYYLRCLPDDPIRAPVRAD